MHIVCTHPDNVDEAFVDDVPDLTDEIEAMMSLQRDRVRETTALAMSDEHMWDPLGGAGDEEDGSKLSLLDIDQSQAEFNLSDEPDETIFEDLGLEGLFAFDDHHPQAASSQVPAQIMSRATSSQARAEVVPSAASSQVLAGRMPPAASS